MGRVRVSFLGLLVGGMLASATLLLNDTFSGEATEAFRPAWPRHVGGAFTVPVRMDGPTDLRVYVLPIGLAVLLVFSEFFGDRRPAGVRAFERLALVAVLWSLLSAAVNGTWDLSRGWIFAFISGAGCAVMLARLTRWNDVFWMGGCAVVVAVVGSGATLWHLRQLGEAFVGRPIGPVTLISALGALWCVIAATVAIGNLALPSRRRVAGICLGAGFAILSWRLLQTGGRGAGLVGVLAGAGYAAVMMVLLRIRSSRGRWSAVGVALVGVVAVGVWGAGRVIEPGRTLASRFATRLIYVNKAAELVPEWWLAGYGPDMFVCRMTTALARQRAETPKFLVGNVDLDAHNEWLQAGLEMGVVGGSLYLAIPILVLFLASRAVLRGGSVVRRVSIVACAAGLVAIVTAESVSINLRYSTLSTWYWVLTGILLAMVNRGSVGMRTGSSGHRIGAILAACVIVLMVAQDFAAVRAHGEGRKELGVDDAIAVQRLKRGIQRMGAASWLASHRDLGNAALNRARPKAASASTMPSGNNEWSQLAVDTLRPLYEHSPAYPSAGFRLGEALALSGRLDEARAHTGAYLKRYNPYDTQANLFFAAIGQLPPIEVLDCVRRSLRDSEWQKAMDVHATAAFQKDETEGPWAERVQRAAADLQSDDPEKWQDRIAPETMRLEAVRLMYEGRLADAARAQDMARAIYRSLNDRMSKYRRPVRAEVDASLRSAEIVFSVEPRLYRKAHELVCEAEIYATGELTRGRRPTARERVEGTTLVISAAQMPSALQRLWQFSAALNLAMGADVRDVRVRILLGLPIDKRTPDSIESERRRLATQLVTIFKDLPESDRPQNWDQLVKLSTGH